MTTEKPGEGLDPGVQQPQFHWTIPMTESSHTWPKGMSYQIGSQGSDPSTIGDAGPLSNAQVQELTWKQATAFRLPTAQREKSGWWIAPPSLASLGCQDFLLPSPSRPQGPRDIWVVRRDQMVDWGGPCNSALNGQGHPHYTLQCSPGPL